MTVDLFVTAGPNRGAYLPIAPGRYVVGSGDDADVVLEGTPASGSLILDVGSDRVRLTPAAGALARVDGRALGRGGSTLDPGAVIEFGDVEFRAFWEGAEVGGKNAGGKSRVGWGLRLFGILVVLAGAGLFVAEAWQQDLRRSQRLGENSVAAPKVAVQDSPRVDNIPRRQLQGAAPLTGSMLEGVEARVRSVLRGTGLSGKLDKGRLVVTGSVLTSKDEKRLEAMIAEVRPYIDVDVSGVRGLGAGNRSVAPATQQAVAPARIVAINVADSGPAKSYFETQDGARYFEGAIFGEGYVVAEIRPTMVAMEKGGIRVEYPLTGH